LTTGGIIIKGRVGKGNMQSLHLDIYRKLYLIRKAEEKIRENYIRATPTGKILSRPAEIKQELANEDFLIKKELIPAIKIIAGNLA
jgi:hypothetical protein